jgi:putative aldouronate transport system substrate-binding protein
MDAKAAGTFLISSRIAAPFHEISESNQFGYTETTRDIVGVNSTNGPRGAIHAISTVSKNPGVALQVLDLVNSDTTVHNLLARGVEGVHYNLENGKIRFTDEKANYTVWPAGLGRLSDLIPTVDDPDPADWKAGIEKFNNVETSPLMGWLFNPAPVETQMGTLRNVVEEYYPALICGSVDPAVALPEFIQKLKDNGLDAVVAEANAQVQAFLAA